jgi:hypothetical protein
VFGEAKRSRHAVSGVVVRAVAQDQLDSTVVAIDSELAALG